MPESPPSHTRRAPDGPEERTFEERFRYWADLAHDLGPTSSLVLFRFGSGGAIPRSLPRATLEAAWERIRSGLRRMDCMRPLGEGALVLMPVSSRVTARRAVARYRARVEGVSGDGAVPEIGVRAGVIELEPSMTLEAAIRAVEEAFLRPSGRDGGSDAPEPVTPRVLLIEDDVPAAHLVRDRLERAGFEVIWHENGRVALDFLEREAVDLTIVDVRLAGADGFDVLRAIRTRHDATEHPVIVMTDLDADDYISRAFAMGANDFVFKPFSTAEMLARVEHLLPAD